MVETKEDVQADLITVIVRVYHGTDPAHLRRCLESLVLQTYRNIEILVMFEMSYTVQDEALRTVIPPDPRIGIVKSEGQIRQLNEGIRLARGSYVAILDSDDWSDPKRLQYQVAYMKHHGLGMCGTAAHVADGEGHVIGEYRPPTSQEELRRSIMHGYVIIHSSVMFHRDTLLKVGPYNTYAVRAEDYDMFLRWIVSECRVGNMPDLLTYYRRHPGQGGAIRHREIPRYMQGIRQVAVSSYGYDTLRDRLTCMVYGVITAFPWLIPRLGRFGLMRRYG